MRRGVYRAGAREQSRRPAFRRAGTYPSVLGPPQSRRSKEPMTRRRSIQIGAIENAGPNTLVAFLRNAGAGCTQIDIAVAFVTAAGLDSLLYLLQQAASKGAVRVLTGLYQGFTEPKALSTLLRAQEQTGGRLSVRVSRDGHFHWKAY